MPRETRRRREAVAPDEPIDLLGPWELDACILDTDEGKTAAHGGTAAHTSSYFER
jgi:hypothetical protein